MKYSQDQIESEISSYKDNPLVHGSSIGYPYYLLSPRQFEMLLYLLFRQDIEVKRYEKEFDDVCFMTGMGERGRDCILYYYGNRAGVVQCKHSTNPSSRIDKSTVACEIIKFALHYLQDNSLISNPDNFVYYFAVSGDFTEPAIDLLSDFNRRIAEEAKYTTWVKKVIKQYKSFRELEFDEIKNILAEVLHSIKVRRVTATDLNERLSNYDSLISLFFSVRKVISVEDAERLLAEARQLSQATIQSQSSSSDQLLLEIQKILGSSSYALSVVDEAKPESSSEHGVELDFIKQLLNDFMSEQALSYLQSLKERIWDDASPDDRYRLLIYMGFAHLQQNKHDTAAQLFIDAYQFKPNSAKATCNAAMGFLLKSENAQCQQLAKNAIKSDPTLLQAYALLVESSVDEPFDNVVLKVPETYRNTTEVAMALGNLAQQKNLVEEAEYWYRIAVQKDSHEHPDIRGKLATALMTKVLQDRQHFSQMPGFVNPYKETIAEIIELYDFAWTRVSETQIRQFRLE